MLPEHVYQYEVLRAFVPSGISDILEREIIPRHHFDLRKFSRLLLEKHGIEGPYAAWKVVIRDNFGNVISDYAIKELKADRQLERSNA
jgi:hypothetical protein